MNKIKNPYADSLKGLNINNPVKSFFEFCIERENIRKRREQGLSPPWTNDPIFKQGRFLNVFREDDRGTKAILRFTRNIENDLETLIQSLFFARWCNKQKTLDRISFQLLYKPQDLKLQIGKINNWCNTTAYPVGPIYWEGKKYSRLDSATSLFYQIKEPLTKLVKNSNGNIINATNKINKRFKMVNDFPIFMAVSDIAWFKPEIIKPNSPVPTGIGAVAYLDILQKYLKLDSHQATCDKMIELQSNHWPNAKRKFQPIDIEYLACECRKYFSYKNGTKYFEGKNLFKPEKK